MRIILHTLLLDPSDQKTTKNNPRRPLKRPQLPPTSNFPLLSYSSGQYFTAKCPRWKLQNLILPNHTDTSEGEFNHQLVYIPAHACKHSYARARWLPQKVALADWKRFIRCWMMMKAASLVWTEKSEHCDVGVGCTGADVVCQTPKKQLNFQKWDLRNCITDGVNLHENYIVSCPITPIPIFIQW